METTNDGTNNHSSALSLPATKITRAFEEAKSDKRGVLIPYFMCGYPGASQSVELVLAATSAGADIIELGMPFSDPLADGATIQHAGHVALERGMNIDGCMNIARQVSARSNVPLLLMGYYNPVLAFGIERFCQTAAASGVCGLIIPDLPPEEAAPLQHAAKHHGLAMIFLVPPTATNERISQIVQVAAQEPKGFLYCVSLSGVTGSRSTLPADLQQFVSRVYGYTKELGLPIAVGFGISTPEHVAEVTRFADGAIVGSAIVKLIDRYAEDAQVEAVKSYIESLQAHARLR
jgi:tryptophan synthase alpha chain